RQEKGRGGLTQGLSKSRLRRAFTLHWRMRQIISPQNNRRPRSCSIASGVNVEGNRAVVKPRLETPPVARRPRVVGHRVAVIVPGVVLLHPAQANLLGGDS